MILIRDLSDLKSSRDSWIDILDENLLYLGYKPLISDMDFWMNPNTNPITDK